MLKPPLHASLLNRHTVVLQYSAPMAASNAALSSVFTPVQWTLIINEGDPQTGDAFVYVLYLALKDASILTSQGISWVS